MIKGLQINQIYVLVLNTEHEATSVGDCSTGQTGHHQGRHKVPADV